jgi:hypothetical protein
MSRRFKALYHFRFLKHLHVHYASLSFKKRNSYKALLSRGTAPV